jgi:NAD(P)-dependent dehydrogenase (short-subunit alcohol dehydrogenase family)
VTLAGKTALITSDTYGIESAVAERMASEGDRPFIRYSKVTVPNGVN